MSIFARYPVIVLEKNAVENYLKTGQKTTDNARKKVGSTLTDMFTEVEVKNECMSEVPAEIDSKDKIEAVSPNIKCEVQTLVSPSDDNAHLNKKPYISELVVEVKKEKEESGEITYDLVRYFSDQSLDQNGNPLLTIKCENIKSDDDKINICFDSNTSNIPVGNKSTVINAFDGSINASQIQSNVSLEWSCTKGVDTSMTLKDSTSGERQEVHANEDSCLYIYYQGKFRNGIDTERMLKNQKTKKIVHSSDSKRESEVQTINKLSVCNKSISKLNKESVKHSINSVKRPLHCNLCPAKSQCNRELNRHVKAHSNEREFKCKYCLAKFKTSSNLKFHLKAHSNDKPFLCNLCPKNFKHNYLLKRHLSVHSDERIFKCYECSAAFKHRLHLISHFKVHSDERPFECELCLTKFKRRNGLEKHMKSHIDERIFKCDQCSAEFKHKHSLINHFKVHSDEKPFECEFCHAKFKRRSGLESHMKSHSDERTFKCDQCSVEFKHKHSLIYHFKVHSDEKPFECEFCHAKFKWSHSLKRHLKLHSDERPLKCKQSPATFKHRSALKIHTSLHANGQPRVYEHWLAKYKRSKVLKQQMLLDSDNRLFQCAYCSAKFKQLCDLYKHMPTHSNERPLKCDLSPANFNENCTARNHTNVPSLKALDTQEKPENERLKTFRNRAGSIMSMISHNEERFFQQTDSLSNDNSTVAIAEPVINITSLSELSSATEPNSVTVISEKPLENPSVSELNVRLKPCMRETLIEKSSKSDDCRKKSKNCADFEHAVSSREKRSVQPIIPLMNGLSRVATVGPMVCKSNLISPKLNGTVQPNAMKEVSDNPPVNLSVGDLNRRQDPHQKEVANIEEPFKSEWLKRSGSCASLTQRSIPQSLEKSCQSTNSLSMPVTTVKPATGTSDMTSPKSNGAMEPNSEKVVRDVPLMNLTVGKQIGRIPCPNEVYDIEEPFKSNDWLTMLENCASIIQHLTPLSLERSSQWANSSCNLSPLAADTATTSGSNTTFPELDGASEFSSKSVIPEQSMNLPVGELNERPETRSKEVGAVECDEWLKTFENCAGLTEQIQPREERCCQPTSSLSSDLAPMVTVGPIPRRSDMASCELNGAMKPVITIVTSDELPVSPVGGKLHVRLKEAYNVEEKLKCDQRLETFENCASLINLPMEERSFQPTNSLTLNLSPAATVGSITCQSNMSAFKLSGAMEHSKVVISDEVLVNLPWRELNKRLKPYPKEIVLECKLRRRTLKSRGYERNCRSRRARQRRAMEEQNKALQAELSLIKEGINKLMRHCACRVW